jgi:hypothetical protein
VGGRVARWVGRKVDDAIERISARDPDFIIGGRERPYMFRWWVIPRNRWFNIYLHQFLRSDDDRALHDHPWWNVSVLLRGAYTEHMVKAGGVNVRVRRAAGAVKARGATFAHRIELTDGACWTLFITGPRIRSWGFHCPGGWVHWEEFTAPTDKGAIGRGCGEQP